MFGSLKFMMGWDHDDMMERICDHMYNLFPTLELIVAVND